VTAYYVYAGDTVAAAELSAYLGWTGVACTFVVVALVTWMANRFGKRTAFIIATSLATFGYAIKWFCYNPEAPYLLFIPAPFLAFGLGGLFTLMPSMMADIVDRDELRTHQRREGMYASIYWWVVKLGQGAPPPWAPICWPIPALMWLWAARKPKRRCCWLRIYDIGLADRVLPDGHPLDCDLGRLARKVRSRPGRA
jgi:GPH family glycoside/pentoside/hexuronide:cation symporter